MPRPYNLTNMTSANDLYGLADKANELASGGLGFLILVGTIFISFMSFKVFDTKRAFAGSMFLGSIVAILLNILGWLGSAWMYGCFILTGISIMALMWKG